MTSSFNFVASSMLTSSSLEMFSTLSVARPPLKFLVIEIFAPAKDNAGVLGYPAGQ